MIETTSAGQNVEIDAAQDLVRAEAILVRPLDGEDRVPSCLLAQPEAALEPGAARADDEVDDKIEAAASA